MVAAFQKTKHQKKTYKLAQRRAAETGKLLLVIGDPRAPNTINERMPTYGCGDICVDLAGCSRCPASTRVLKMDLVEALRDMPDNSAVIYESETLDYLPSESITTAVREMKRVSGGDIFATHFVGVRTPLLLPKYRDSWQPKRLIVSYPPHAPDYKWLENVHTASWQSVHR